MTHSSDPSIFTCLALSLALLVSGCDSSNNDQVSEHPPNILFIIMDDVGIDQMTVFGYGGVGPFDQRPNSPEQPDDRAPALPNAPVAPRGGRSCA